MTFIQMNTCCFFEGFYCNYVMTLEVIESEMIEQFSNPQYIYIYIYMTHQLRLRAFDLFKT